MATSIKFPVFSATAQILEKNKVTITRPPRSKDSKGNRYATDLGLHNIDIESQFTPISSASTRKNRQIKSATSRLKSNLVAPRRVHSAKERQTTEWKFAKPISRQQLTLYESPYQHEANKVFPQSKRQSIVLEDCEDTVKGTARNLTSADKVSQKSVPKTLQTLSQYLSYEVPDCLDHPALRGSIVILPGLSDIYGHDLPLLPSLQNAEDDYPYTHDVPAEHIHRPKKYSHPYYERLKKIKGWTCNHSGREIRVGSLTGETIHRLVINQQRNQTSIRDEIVELERLIKGLSTEWSTSTVVLYQNEINDLQTMVKHTLSLTSQPETPPQTPDPTGLRKFCTEYDTALQALIARRQQCMSELEELEEMNRLYDRAKQLEGLSLN